MDSDGGDPMTVKLVSDEKIAETSSKGNQEKWLDQGKWYKLDQFGYEALAETFTSMLLEHSNIERETPFTFTRYQRLFTERRYRMILGQSPLKTTPAASVRRKADRHGRLCVRRRCTVGSRG